MRNTLLINASVNGEGVAALNELAAVILAAGASRRFGDENKLLAEIEHRAIADIVFECVAGLGLKDTVVVVGHEAERLRKLTEARGLRHVIADDYQRGMGHSLASGITRLRSAPAGVFVVLADMPFARRDVFEELAQMLEDEHDICRPRYEGIPGHPVLFGRQHLEALSQLQGDTGARALLADNARHTRWLEWPDNGVVRDIDKHGDIPPKDHHEPRAYKH